MLRHKHIVSYEALGPGQFEQPRFHFLECHRISGREASESVGAFLALIAPFLQHSADLPV